VKYRNSIQAVEWPRSTAKSASCSVTVASWTTTSAPLAAISRDRESLVSPRITAHNNALTALDALRGDPREDHDRENSILRHACFHPKLPIVISKDLTNCKDSSRLKNIGAGTNKHGVIAWSLITYNSIPKDKRKHTNFTSLSLWAYHICRFYLYKCSSKLASCNVLINGPGEKASGPRQRNPLLLQDPCQLHVAHLYEIVKNSVFSLRLKNKQKHSAFMPSRAPQQTLGASCCGKSTQNDQVFLVLSCDAQWVHTGLGSRTNPQDTHGNLVKKNKWPSS